MKTAFGRKFRKMIDELSPEELRALAVKCGISKDAFETTTVVDEPTPTVKPVSEELRELAGRLREEAGLDHRSRDAKAHALETLATRCEGMYTADEVEEAIDEVVAEHGKPQWYESRADFVADIMARLKGGS